MANFVPKQYKTEQITIRSSVEKLERIDTAAARYNISRSEFINQCIDYAMEHMAGDKEVPHG
ncbi:MAG: hypothetical protein J6S59_02590 [Clostridia bacterium]|nr:hypothetical protein [Clostridia bacterium]